MVNLHHAPNQQLELQLRTIKKYQSSISNTFDHPTITNGPIEGIDNKIKVPKRNTTVIVTIPFSGTIYF